MTRPKTAALAAPARDADVFVLPHSLEAERATLGAALIAEAAADWIVDHLTEGMYFRRAHRAIFLAIRTLREQHTAPDFLTVKERLGAKALDEVGGPVYLAGLVDGLPQSSHVAYYGGILQDLHLRRVLAGYAHATLDLVAAGAHSGAAILADADRRLMAVQGGHTESRMSSVGAGVLALSNDLEWRTQHKGELTGVDTGYASLNEQTLGWQAGDLNIIAARPSIGKTTFVLNTAVHAARSGRQVAIFSLEMRRRQLEFKLLAQLAGVDLSRIRGGFLGDAEYPLVAEAICEMGKLAVSIDDQSGQTVGEIRASCRRLKAEGGLDLVVIDYVQLMAGTLDRRGATRNEELTDISRRLKVMADELHVAILLLSQLNRGSEDRPDPRPKLRDLRDCGGLEQDADIVAFLHRRQHREGGTTQFIIEKQRNGPTGTVNLTLDRERSTFTDGGDDPAPEPEAEKPARKAAPRLFARRGNSSGQQ